MALSAVVTRAPASFNRSASCAEALASSDDSASRAPNSEVRALSALSTIASRSRASSSISRRMRRSFSLCERSRLVTSVRTMTSSSPARASARSMPSPIDAASRRIACDSVTTCSVATASGSISRIAASVIALATSRISWALRAVTPVTKKNTIGPNSASSVSTGDGARKLPSGPKMLSRWK